MDYQQIKEKKYLGTLQIKCVVCDTLFMSFPSAQRKYCSRKCYLKKHSTEIKRCVQCNKDFKKPGEPNQKFCSRKCYLLNQHSNNFVPNYNKEGCLIIEEYGQKHGYNFQHAENGGEIYLENLGYWLDGYDRDKNVVIEYMEKHHRYRTKKDKQRKKEIIEFLNCKYIEVWE